MEALDDKQVHINELTVYLITKANDLIEKGCTPQFAEKLILHAVCNTELPEIESEIKTVCKDIVRWALDEISEENRGLVLSDFLYQMLVPSVAVSHRLLDRRSHVRLPTELVWIMAQLLGNSFKRTFAPCLQSIQLAMACTAFSEEVVSTVPGELSLMHALNHGFKNLTLRTQIPAQKDGEDFSRVEFDSLCGWFPIQKHSVQVPFKVAGESYAPNTAELADLYQIVSTRPLRSVVLVGCGLLSSSGVFESKFKNFLQSQNMLEAVIELPEGIIPGLRWRSALLVLDSRRNKNEQTKVSMLDASSGFHKSHPSIPRLSYLSNWHHITSSLLQGSGKGIIQVPADDLDLDLSPRRYIAQKKALKSSGGKYKALQELADLYRGRSIGKAIDLPEEDLLSMEDNLYFEATIRDIGEDHILNRPQKVVRAEMLTTESRKNLILQPWDILLSIKGVIGHVALVPEIEKRNWMPNQSFQVIRVKEGYDPISLFYQLLSGDIQNLLYSKVTGSSVRQVKAADIKSLQIPVLSDMDQNFIREHYLNTVENKERISKLQAENKEEVKKIFNILNRPKKDFRPSEDFVFF